MALLPSDAQRRRARKLLRKAIVDFSNNTIPPATLHAIPLEDRLTPAITGTVFQDFNANGLLDTNSNIANNSSGVVSGSTDIGVAGVSVTAYDTANKVAGSAVSNSVGQYSLNLPGVGPFRIEFGSLPNGFVPGPAGATQNTLVQFTGTNTQSNVNLAIVHGSDVSSAPNPLLVTNSYVFGGITSNDLYSTSAVLLSTPYSSGSSASDTSRIDYQNPATHTLAIPQSQIGATWGLGYNSQAATLYAAAFMKRLSGFGPSGAGAIYETGTTGNTASTFVDLNALFANAPGGDISNLFKDSKGNPVSFRNPSLINGTDPSNYWLTDGLTRVTDSTGVQRDIGWDSVGKIALGGLAVDESGSHVYVMALGDRMLYVVPTSGPLNATTIKHFAIPLPSDVTGNTVANPLGDLRPFAVQEYRGIIYVGAVNSAESTQKASDLHAYVFAFDPAKGAFVDSTRAITTSKPVLEFNLNYPRGYAYVGGDGVQQDGAPYSAMWNPWSPIFKTVAPWPSAEGRVVYPQPMLTGLAFDSSGNITLGIRDRLGDQVGYIAPADPLNPTQHQYLAMSAGDTLKAFINSPGNLDQVDASGTAPFSGWTLESNSRSPDLTQGSGPQFTGQGPGDGEFYYQDDLPRDPTQKPIGLVDEHQELSLGGVAQIPGFPDVVTTNYDPVRIAGAVNGGGFRWYNTSTGTLTKSYELYVTPISGGSGTFAKANGMGDVVAITTPAPTEIGDRVWFDANANGIQDANEPGIAGVKVNLVDSSGKFIASATTDSQGYYLFSTAQAPSSQSSIFNLNLQPGVQYLVQIPTSQTPLVGYSLTQANADTSPGGTNRDSNAVLSGNNAVISVTPTLQNPSIRSLDAGFTPPLTLSLGDTVWNDLNNDGSRSANEPGVDGVTVNLYASDGTTLLGSTTTSNGGKYNFANLNPGTYIVEIVPPTGFISSTGTIGSLTGPFEPGVNNSTDNVDHGTQVGSRIRTAVVTLYPQGDSRNVDSDGVRPNNANFRQDFGIIKPLSIGDTVWNDLNNDGILQAGEPGLSNVTVNLLNGTGSLVASTVTNSAGGYLFTGLIPGQYQVEIVRSSLPSADFISSTGKLGSASGPFEPAPGNTVDGTDHGTTSGNFVVGPMINLAYGSQPAGEAAIPGGMVDPAADVDSNRLQDFGFFRPLSIGDTVWNDVNNNGKLDTGEVGIDGISVDLLDSKGNVIGTTMTANGGHYLFSDLTAAQYQVRITAPAGYRSSTGTNGSLTSGPYEPGVTANINSADHGTTAGNFIVAAPITLANPGDSANPDQNGTANLDQDFGLFRPLAIGDFVWNDVNNNGKLDAGEQPLAGIPVTLRDSSGATVAITSTDGNGLYRFDGLTAGAYTIQITPPPGYLSSTGTVSSLSGPYEPGVSGTQNNEDHGTQAGALVTSQVTLTLAGNPDENGFANLRQDFGLFQPLTVGNQVWNDLNNNGKFDPNESGIANVPVTLRDGNGNVVSTTTTDSNGTYLFNNLVPGQYSVQITAPTGFQSSSGTSGSLTGPFEPGVSDNTDNVDHGTQGAGQLVSTAAFTLFAPGSNQNPDNGGTANLRQDFGLYSPLSIGDFVWNDVNNSGVFDSGDLPLDGVTVQLLDAAGNTLASQTTSNGHYLFTNLSPGTYRVRVLPPAGFLSSTGTPGSLSGPYEPGVSSNTDNVDHGTQVGTAVLSSPIILGAPGDTNANPDNGGSANLRQDFGLYQPLAIGDLVWNDINNNGQRDTGEPGLAGVKVDLLENNAVVASTVTDANGNYLFSNLSSGTYSVRITAPSGFLSSSGSNGSRTGPYEPGVTGTGNNVDHGTTSGAFVVTSPFVLGIPGDTTANPDNNGSANLRQDFGLYQPLAIGDFVFNDANNNGVLDSGETGVNGVAVSLINADTSATVATTITANGGQYLFSDLAPGRYIVQIVAPTGMRSSTGGGLEASTGPFEPVASDDGNNNEDKGTQNGNVIHTNVVTLGIPGSTLNPDSSGLANLRQDFGLAPPIVVPPVVVPPVSPPPVTLPASVSGYVYRDINSINGTRETANGETGIPGTSVTLTGVDNAGNTITPITVITDVNGFYKFSNLAPGNYRIVETQPLGFLDGIDTPGSLGGTSPSNDVLSVVLAAGQNGTEYNFGEILPSSVYGYVYFDANKNQRRDPGETGISNVTVTITGTVFDNSPLARALQPGDSPVGLSVKTDANGRYTFPYLPPGTFTVTETPPPGYATYSQAVQEPFTMPVNVGVNQFTGVVAGPGVGRGALNFGVTITDAVIATDPTKRDFLGSTQTGGSIAVPPTTSPPITVGPTNLSTNPPFSVSTGNPAVPALLVTSAGTGAPPLVRVFDYATSTQKFNFLAYESSFTGGVRATTADVNGDGVADIITSTGVGGGPRVRIFSGKDGSVLNDYFAYESTFRGGVFVAAGDVEGNGRADIITGTEIGGGPRITVRNLQTGQVIHDFFAFDSNQRGGVRIATADFNGDGHADIVASTGAGVPTRVRVFDGVTLAILADFAPYASNFTGGVFIAAGNVLGGTTPDIITGADTGGGPHVQVFKGLTGQPAVGFYAYDASFTGGVRVAALDVNGDGRTEVITAPGAGYTPQIKIWSGSAQVLETFGAFDNNLDGGVYVG